MKAKVRNTGEIVDIVSITDMEYGCLISYWDSKNKKEYSRFELDFNVNGETNDDTTKHINWEERRYEIAKAAMVGVLAMPTTEGVNPNPTMADVCELSVKFADALIEELKKTSK
nr:hypothetical protein [uncultured Prevotella sp.]